VLSYVEQRGRFKVLFPAFAWIDRQKIRKKHQNTRWLDPGASQMQCVHVTVEINRSLDSWATDKPMEWEINSVQSATDEYSNWNSVSSIRVLGSDSAHVDVRLCQTLRPFVSGNHQSGRRFLVLWSSMVMHWAYIWQLLSETYTYVQSHTIFITFIIALPSNWNEEIKRCICEQICSKRWGLNGLHMGL
jgi:hypothetical protein